MFKYSLVLLSMILLLACSQEKNKVEEKENNNELIAMTVADFQNIDESYTDKVVEITGTVNHVCKHGGKKMFIIDDDNHKVKLMATENVPVFDVAYEGTKVTIVGKVAMEKLDEAYLVEWEKEIGESEDCAVETEMKTGEAAHEHEGDGHDHSDQANKQLAKIKEMREEMNTNGKGYIPVFTVECNEVNTQKI